MKNTAHATPYEFRHAKASHWLEDGMNIVQISFLLGHEQLQTTMTYLDITTEEKQRHLLLWKMKMIRRCLQNGRMPMVHWWISGIRSKE